MIAEQSEALERRMLALLVIYYVITAFVMTWLFSKQNQHETQVYIVSCLNIFFTIFSFI